MHNVYFGLHKGVALRRTTAFLDCFQHIYMYHCCTGLRFARPSRATSLSFAQLCSTSLNTTTRPPMKGCKLPRWVRDVSTAVPPSLKGVSTIDGSSSDECSRHLPPSRWASHGTPEKPFRGNTVGVSNGPWTSSQRCGVALAWMRWSARPAT